MRKTKCCMVDVRSCREAFVLLLYNDQDPTRFVIIKNYYLNVLILTLTKLTAVEMSEQNYTSVYCRLGSQSNRYGLYKLGYRFATLINTMKNLELTNKFLKFVLSTYYFLQFENLQCKKSEWLVIENQQSFGEFVLLLCTNRPSRFGI